jgi:hypothetical protein
MRTEGATTNGKVASESPLPPTRNEETLRALATQHLERVRKFKLDAAVFVVGILVLAGVWAITEYQNSGGWPERLSDKGQPGDWNPWILWVVLGWGFLLALDALRTYFRRPTTEAEIEREVERMSSGRRKGVQP